MSSTITAISQLLDALTRLPFITGVLTKGSLLILLAVGLTRLLARAPAAARHLVWSLSVTGLLLLPTTTWMPWRLELPLLTTARETLGLTSPIVQSVGDGASTADETPAPTPLDSEASPLANTAAAGLTSDAERSVGSDGSSAATPTAGFASSIARRFGDPAAVLMAIWLGGILWMLGRLLFGMASVRRMVSHAVPADGPEWTDLIDTARAALGAGPVAGIVISERAAMPFTYGLLRPIIVLPSAAEYWSTERRRSVLLHELAHVRRRDLLTNAIVQLACALYWFHPLIHLAARRVRIEAERACDALVVGAGTLPSDYAGDLLEIARTMRSSATGAVALAMARRSDFEGRLLAILAPEAGRNVLTAARAALVALSFAGPAIAVAAAEPARRGEPNAPAVASQVDTGAGRSVEPGAIRARSETQSASSTSRVEQNTVEPQAGAQAQGRDVAVPALLSVVRDENATVRLAAVQALGQQGDPRAIDALGEALRTDTDARVREAAASALGEIDSPRAVPALIAALGSERVTPVRAKIAWALGEIDDTRAVDALANALRDQAVEVRRQAAWALGEIESVDAVTPLLAVLRDSDAETRKQAAWALGQIESAEAVAGLSAAAKDADAGVREQAVEALGEIGDVRALPALTAALGDDEVDVRRSAISAIGNLENLRSAPPALIAALRDADREVKKAAAEALGSLEDESAVPALIPLTRDTDGEVKRAAVQALSDIGGVRAIEAIVVLLKDEDPEIRKIAAEALGKR